MKKNRFFSLLALIVGFGFFTQLGCSKDDGCEPLTYYLDKDLDNYGAGAPITTCAPPTSSLGQYVLKNGDTNDENANMHPGCVLAFYVDGDGDGFGVGDPIYFCEAPLEGYTDNGEVFDCDDNNSDINPNTATAIYYRDEDGDGYGDSNATTAVSECAGIPDGYVENADDCDDTNANRNPGAGNIFVYTDKDGDGYGNDDLFVMQDSCIDLIENQSFESGDCDDNDVSIHPGAIEDSATDGIDQDCDGTIEPIVWDGSPYQFIKPAFEDWAKGLQYQDVLTDNVTLTRSTTGYITNIDWWLDNFATLPNETNDLGWEHNGRKALNPPSIAVGEAVPSGGPQGVRWAILEQGKDNDAWNNFDMYGTLGDPTNYLSLNNIITICQFLDINQGVVSIVDDFGVNFEPGEEPASDDASSENFPFLVGKALGVWLVEENIYFTLTFEELSQIGQNQGGSMTYTRSSPNQ